MADAAPVGFFSYAEVAAAMSAVQGRPISKETVERAARAGIYGPVTLMGGMMFVTRQALVDEICRNLADPKDTRRAAIEAWDKVVAHDKAEAEADRTRQAAERAYKQSPEGRREQAQAFREASERQSEKSDGSRPGRHPGISILNPMRDGRRGPTPVEQSATAVSVPAMLEQERKANPGKPFGARTGFPVDLNAALVPAGQIPADTNNIESGARA